MSQETQVAPVATNTPFEYNENLTIAIGVSDMEKAIEWYGEVLGLELVYKLEEHGWCEMSTATRHVTIGLGQTEEVEARQHHSHVRRQGHRRVPEAPRVPRRPLRRRHVRDRGHGQALHVLRPRRQLVHARGEPHLGDSFVDSLG